MADLMADGNTRIAFVASIANIASVTTTEANLGILLQTFVTADGIVGWEATTAEVDTTSVASTFNSKNLGRDDFSGTLLRFKKQTYGADTPYTTLVRGTAGFILFRRGILETTAWTSAQAIEVYPIVCGQVKMLAPEANSVQRYEVPMMITSAPNLRAVIA